MLYATRFGGNTTGDSYEMKRFSEVRVFDPTGKLKETISVDTLCKTLWKNAEEEDAHTSITRKTDRAGKATKAYQKKTFPMITCRYKPCSKSIQKLSTKHFFCIDRVNASNSCSTKQIKVDVKKKTNARNALREAGGIINTCRNCKKKYSEVIAKQKYCRNPCKSMITLVPKIIENIKCKRCKKASKGILSRRTLYCGNPCTYELHRRDLVAVKVDRQCVLCKEMYKGRKNIASMYCHNPCNSKLAKESKDVSQEGSG